MGPVSNHLPMGRCRSLHPRAATVAALLLIVTALVTSPAMASGTSATGVTGSGLVGSHGLGSLDGWDLPPALKDGSGGLHPAAIWTLIDEDFEGGVWPAGWSRDDQEPTSGADYWGVDGPGTGGRAHTGAKSVWASQVGTNSGTGNPNTDTHDYDHDQEAWMEYDFGNATGFDSLSLGFWYWYSSEATYDTIQVYYWADDFPGEYPVAWQDSDGSSGGWRNTVIAIPTNASIIGFFFGSDFNNIPPIDYEGTYLDDILLTGVDTKSPAKVTGLTSTTHTVSSWSTLNQVDVTWTASTDWGSRLDGYSVFWDTSPLTLPITVKNREELISSETSPVLADGNAHYFHIRPVDNAGNWALAINTAHLGPFWIDTVDPSALSGLTSPSHTISAWANDNTVDLSWVAATDATSGLDGYAILWDSSPSSLPTAQGQGKTLEEGITSVASAALADGTGHYVHLQSKDNAGNWDDTSVDVGPFWIDTAPPTNPNSFSATESIDSWFGVADLTIDWSGASDGTGSGVSDYSWLWNQNAATLPDTISEGDQSIASNATTLPTDSPGWYFHIRTKDAAGNWNAGAAHFGPFKFDGTDPVNPTTLTSPTHQVGSWSNNPIVEVRWSGSDGAVSGIDGFSWSFTTAPTTIPDSIPDGNGSADQAISPTLGDSDSQWFHIRTLDAAGNWNLSASHLGPFMIDTIPPSSLGLEIAQGATFVNSSLVEVAVTAADSASGLDDMAFSTDGGATWGAWIPYSVGSTLTLPPGDGERQVLLRVRDAAGNVATNGIDDVSVDTSPPQISAFVVNDDRPWSNTATIPIEVLANDGTGSGSVLAQVRQEAGGSSALASPTSLITFTLSGADGSKSLTLSLSDAMGNRVTSDPIVVRLDRTAPDAPAVVLAQGRGFARSFTIDASVTISDNLGRPQVRISDDGGTTFGDWQDPAALFSWTFASNDGEGARSLVVEGRDEAGNVGESTLASVFIDTKAPIGVQLQVLGAPVSGLVSTPSLTLAVSGADPSPSSGSLTMALEMDGAGFGAAQPFTGELPVQLLGDGVHQLRLRVTDRAGNEATSPTLTLTLDTTPPRIIELRVDVPEEPDGSATVIYQLSERSTVQLLYGPSGQEQRLLANTELMASGSFPLTSLDLGTEYTVQVDATDGAGNGPTHSQVVTFLPELGTVDPNDPLSGVIDLTIAWTDQTRLTAEPGEQVSLNLLVSNTGDRAARDVLIVVTRDGARIASLQLALLPPGSSLPVSLSWNATRGHQDLVAVIDPDGAISERSEGDNTATREARVGAASSVTPGAQALLGSIFPLLLLLIVAAVILAVLVRGRSRRSEVDPLDGPGPTTAPEADPPHLGQVDLDVAAAPARVAPMMLGDLGKGGGGASGFRPISHALLLSDDGRLIDAVAQTTPVPTSSMEWVQQVQTHFRSHRRAGASAIPPLEAGPGPVVFSAGPHVTVVAVVHGDISAAIKQELVVTVDRVEGINSSLWNDFAGDLSLVAEAATSLTPLLSFIPPARDDEGEVKVLSGIEFYQGYVRLKVAFKNTASTVITEATFRPYYNRTNLSLHRIDPKLPRNGEEIEIGVINPGEKQTVAFYFDPQICQESMLDGILTYRDPHGERRSVNMKRRTVEIVCPIFYTPETVNVGILRRTADRQSYRDNRVYKLPEGIEMPVAFQLSKEVVQAHDVKLVREFASDGPQYWSEAWYYGKANEGKEEIVITTVVREDTQTLEMVVACNNLSSMTGLLAEFSHQLSEKARAYRIFTGDMDRLAQAEPDLLDRLRGEERLLDRYTEKTADSTLEAAD